LKVGSRKAEGFASRDCGAELMRGILKDNLEERETKTAGSPAHDAGRRTGVI